MPFISARFVPAGARWTPPVRSASRATSVVRGSTQTMTGGSCPRVRSRIRAQSTVCVSGMLCP